MISSPTVKGIGAQHFVWIRHLKRPRKSSLHRQRLNSASDSSHNSAVKIYTKTGDNGESSLYNGERVTKTHPIFNALGDVDELNSIVGLAREYVLIQQPDDPLTTQLQFIQSRLLDVGSVVATPQKRSDKQRLDKVAFDPSAVSTIETWIDSTNDELPPLTQFILPSGGLAAAHLHLSRSVCRRAERSVLALSTEDKVEAEVSIFLNRLSDFFFIAARHMALKHGRTEQTYKKGQ